MTGTNGQTSSEGSAEPFPEDLLRALFTRPGMYVGSNDYWLIVAFLRGYHVGVLGCDKPDPTPEGFYHWACARVGVEPSPALGWHSLPLFLLPGIQFDERGVPLLPPDRHEEALKTLQDLLLEYHQECGVTRSVSG